MKKSMFTSRISWRDFLKLAGAGLLASGGAGLVSKLVSGFVLPEAIALAQGELPDKVFAGTDGWMYLPPLPTPSPYHPDDLSPEPRFVYNLYIQLPGLQG